jgi:NADH-quinone oxidoreductase subunit H
VSLGLKKKDNELVSKKMLFQGTWLGGHLQTAIDGAKLFLKEDMQPAVVDKVLHFLAPLMTVAPAIIVLAIVPIGPAVDTWFGGNHYPVNLGITDLPIGILFYMAMTGIGVYGIVMAGWASNSKYSLLGGVRSTAQMLSYEIALGLSLVGLLLIAGSFELRAIIAQQDGGFWNWHVFKQPMAALLFLWAGFAELNRLPFDLPEGESELGGGFHTEYGSMKFAMFFQAEYMNMFTFSAILTTLFLGGFHSPIALPIGADWFDGKIPFLPIEVGGIFHALVGCFWFFFQIFWLISFMVFIRATWPRLRYDQLMDLGWKLMFPAALVNMMLTAGVVAFYPVAAGVAHADIIEKPTTAGLTVVLFLFGVFQIWAWDAFLTAKKKRFINSAA